MKVSILLATVIILLTAQVSLAQEGKELVSKAAEALAATPDSKETRKLEKKAIKWILETKEVTITLCQGATSMISVWDNAHREAMWSAYTIGLTDFTLKNPMAVKDRNAVHLAGIELALKVYEGLVKAKPKTKNELIDLLIEQRDKGELPSAIAVINCGQTKNVQHGKSKNWSYWW